MPSTDHHWIPVTEQLPDDEVSVLTWNDNEIYMGFCIAREDGDGVVWQETGEVMMPLDGVTHWRELPEPPEPS